jgi:hypothetical protein
MRYVKLAYGTDDAAAASWRTHTESKNSTILIDVVRGGLHNMSGGDKCPMIVDEEGRPMERANVGRSRRFIRYRSPEEAAQSKPSAFAEHMTVSTWRHCLGMDIGDVRGPMPRSWACSP